MPDANANNKEVLKVINAYLSRVLKIPKNPNKIES
jgi:hypothetical protein